MNYIKKLFYEFNSKYNICKREIIKIKIDYFNSSENYLL